MAPRLDHARKRISALIAKQGSTCTITHNAMGIDDDSYNPVTMQLVAPNPETTVVYAGPCLLRPTSKGSVKLRSRTISRAKSPIFIGIRPDSQWIW